LLETYDLCCVERITMSEYEHTCYLSDGTKLSNEQYTALMEKGSVVLEDGRTIKTDTRLERDFFYMSDLVSQFKEIE
jgi:hypothetical protein